MLRTRSNPQSQSDLLSPGPTPHREPDTPTAHYDHRTHQHAQAEAEIDPLDREFGTRVKTTSREMNGSSGSGTGSDAAGASGLANRRGEKGMFLNGLSRLQSFGGGGKGKGKAQYRLGQYLFTP
jgi:hypothetical protein